MTEREQQIQKINDSLDYGIEQLHEAKKVFTRRDES